MTNYSIGITTYSYRYEKFLIDLLFQIRKDNQHEIILGINGNYMKDFDEKYRKDILELLGKYNKIFPYVYPNFRSLSKMWNNIVINASNEYVLILNDDTAIVDPIFWKNIEENIDKHQTSFKMNGNFCQFVIKKNELDEMGWFDERFLGIGWEDNEFQERYLKHFNKHFLNIGDVSGIKAFIDFENVITNQRVSFGKYSKFNQEIYNQKLEAIQQYPYEKFYWENKDKL